MNLDESYSEPAKASAAGPRTNRGLRDAFIEALMDSLLDLPQRTRNKLRRIADGRYEVRSQMRTKQPRGRSQMVSTRDVAERLGVTPRWAAKKLRSWSREYGIKLRRLEPDNPQSPLGISREDWQRVRHSQPGLGDRRWRRPPNSRKRPAVLHADLVREIRCPRCGSARLKCNGTRKTLRYFKCRRCDEQESHHKHFIVRFD